jgi:hypothetical protein
MLLYVIGGDWKGLYGCGLYGCGGGKRQFYAYRVYCTIRAWRPHTSYGVMAQSSIEPQTIGFNSLYQFGVSQSSIEPQTIGLNSLGSPNPPFNPKLLKPGTRHPNPELFPEPHLPKSGEGLTS